jgi:beta-lactamase regulating signal transducer with metallopeptidase domain
MLALVLEAALRSMLMAGVVWGCIRLLRMRALPAQKVAWVLVLVAAATMPFVMRAPFAASLLANRGVQIPLHNLPKWLGGAAAPAKAPAVAPAAKIQLTKIPKPSAAHVQRQDEDQSFLEDADALILTKSAGSTDSDVSPAVAVQREAVAQISQFTQPATALSVAGSFVAHKAEPFWSWNRARRIAFAAYFTVVGLLLLRMAAGLALAYRLWLRAKPVAELGSPTGSARRALRVRVSPDLSTPVTIASTVLIPADHADWDEAKLRVVLAHEQSHVKQGDFYLQLVAAVHAAIFWFSPLGWWLQRKLSELGEALSDRAGLEQSESPAFYAQILLEFAAKPRKTSFFTPAAGVAMARNSNLSGRIERILSARGFGISSVGGRRHAVLAAAVVPVALLAAVALVRVAPAVQAAQSVRSVDQATAKGSSRVTGQATGTASGDQVLSVDIAQSVPPPPPAPDVAPPSPPDVEPPTVEPAPAVEAPEAPEPPPAPGHRRDFSYSDDNDDDAIAIIQDSGNTITMNGHGGMGLRKAKEKYHDHFIWFERDGKAYVITDPQIVAQAKEMFKGDPRLEERQKALEARQHVLEAEMSKVASEHAMVKLDSPEFKAQMDKLTAELAKLNTVKITEDLKVNLTQEKLQAIQERVSQIQERLGDIQGQIGEKQGEIGARQGEIGERMGKIGEEMGKIGEEQGRKAEEAAKKLKSVIDQAVKDGKAKPVE